MRTLVAESKAMIIWRNLEPRLLGALLLAATEQNRRDAKASPPTADPPTAQASVTPPWLRLVPGGKDG